MGGIRDRFNLEKQFTFYASYHDNPINKLIHFFCIWPILASAIVLMAETDALMPQPDLLLASSLPFKEYIVLNWSFLPLLVYLPWYIILDWMAGSLAGAIIFAIHIGANYLVQQAPMLFGLPAWKIALPIHIGCWILQFIGHGVFEKRAPALLDSLDQAIITAPLFVLLEILFPLGYSKSLFHRVEKQVKINVKAFHSKRT